MKKALSFILALMMVLPVATAFADTGFSVYIYYQSGAWCSIDSSGRTTYYQDIPPQYDSYMLSRNFPTWVASVDVSDLCEQWHGTPVGLLGLTSDKGINLRTLPNLKDSTRGIQLHAGTTVYVYFEFYYSGREWYYASTADGNRGYLRTNFLQLYPYSPGQ